MRPVEFPQQNTTFAKDQPEYLPLPAYLTPEGAVTSCWALSWRERLRVLRTGRMYFTQHTFGTALQPQLPSTYPPNMETTP